MTPSVGRRKRPRVRSCSFHVLAWLLRREAALRIVFPHSVAAGADLPARAEVVTGAPEARRRAFPRGWEVSHTAARRAWQRTAAQVELVLKLHPERRWWPPETR